MSSTPSVTLSNFTGIDFNQILQADEAAAQIPIAALQNELVGVNTSISTLGTIGGDFSSLQSALNSLNTSLTIPPVGIRVSQNAPFTAAVTGGPINGTYSVTISQLASAQGLASQGYVSSSASVGDGSVTITIGGHPTSITIDSSNDTLAGLAGAINGAGIGVTAQVVNTGAPGAPFRLQITSNATGSAHGFTIATNLSGGAAKSDSVVRAGHRLPGRDFSLCIDRLIVRKNAALQTGLVKTLIDRPSCNAFFDNHAASAAADLYFSRLRTFSEFATQFGKAHRIKRTPFFESFAVPIADHTRIGVASLNTAWLATGEPEDIDRGKLIVPERAIHAAIEDLANCNFKVAILHQPLDYLAEHNRFDCKALLLKHFNLVCTGHLHRPMPEMLRSAIGESVFSEAGCLYASRSFHNGYCLITFDLESRKVDLVHRRWEDSPISKFAEANNVNDHGRTSFCWGDPQEVERVGRLIDVNAALKPSSWSS